LAGVARPRYFEVATMMGFQTPWQKRAERAAFVCHNRVIANWSGGANQMMRKALIPCQDSSSITTARSGTFEKFAPGKSREEALAGFVCLRNGRYIS